MRVKLGKKPLVYPQPVLIIASYDQAGDADAMNAAWGGVSDFDEIIISLSKNHKTVQNILEKKEFSVSIATKKYVAECDYFGIVSGHQVKNKIASAKLTALKCPDIDAPYILELPLTIECRLESYDSEKEILKAKIVDTLIDESILTDGKIDPDKLEAISFDSDNSSYLLVKGKVADAFKVGRTLIK